MGLFNFFKKEKEIVIPQPDTDYTHTVQKMNPTKVGFMKNPYGLTKRVKFVNGKK